MTVDELDRRPFLQRVIWRGHVSAKIKEMYRSISEAVEELKVTDRDILHPNQH